MATPDRPRRGVPTATRRKGAAALSLPGSAPRHAPPLEAAGRGGPPVPARAAVSPPRAGRTLRAPRPARAGLRHGPLLPGWCSPRPFEQQSALPCASEMAEPAAVTGCLRLIFCKGRELSTVRTVCEVAGSCGQERLAEHLPLSFCGIAHHRVVTPLKTRSSRQRATVRQSTPELPVQRFLCIIRAALPGSHSGALHVRIRQIPLRMIFPFYLSAGNKLKYDEK